jgi:beta-lactamase class A
MKKVTALSFLVSLAPVLIAFFFSFDTWLAAETTANLPTTVTIEEPAPAAPLSITTLPLDVPSESVPHLEDLQSQELQEKLEAILRSNKHWAALAGKKALSIGIVDMHDPMNSRFAAINPDNMVYAASLPKIAVLLASEEAIQQGKLKETPEVRQDMRMMIAKSSNSAATRMVERVGLKQIGQIMQDPRYMLYDRENGGGLWVGKAYGRSNGRIGDPIKNLSHAASVEQVCKYYYKLAFGQLVSPERSKDMLSMLVDPELHHKFVSVLDRVAPNAKVYRKSGTWQTWHTDSALVWDEDRRYIVVALAEDAGGETMLRELMLKIDTALTSKG